MEGRNRQSRRIRWAARFRLLGSRLLVAVGLLLVVDGSAGATAPRAGAPLFLHLTHVPFDSSDERGRPNALAHVPSGFDSRRSFRVVLFLHDEDRCIAALASEGTIDCGGGRLVSGWDLAERHDALGDPQSVLVAPALAGDRSSSGAGRLAEPGFARAMIDEVLVTLGDRGLTVPAGGLEEVTVVASGTGFESALAVLSDGDLPVRDVVFLDALYGGTRELLEWIDRDERHRVLSVHAPDGIARVTSRLLLYRALLKSPSTHARSFAFGGDVGDSRVLVVQTRDADEGEIAAGHFEDALRALAR